MSKLWFVRKTYGRGWTPSTWQGWLVLVVFLICYSLNWLRLGDTSNQFLVIEITIESMVMLTILLIVCYKKGEKPKWQWGDKENN